MMILGDMVLGNHWPYFTQYQIYCYIFYDFDVTPVR